MAYTDLRVWHLSRAFARAIYETTDSFPKREIFGLAQQMRRAAVSIPSNIAEGQGRWSHADQIRFYYHARGSLLELETQLYVAHDLGYIELAVLNARLAQTAEIGRKLNALINSLSPEP